MRLRTSTRAGRAGVAAGAAAATLLGLGLVALPAAHAAAAPPFNGATLTARDLPANGKILMVMGQDSDTLSAYQSSVLNNPSLAAPSPGGITLYTNLIEGGNPPALAGMFTTANWGAGNVDFQQTLSQYPNAALSVGLDLSDSGSGCTNQPLRALLGGPGSDITAAMTNQYRGDLTKMINQLKAWNRLTYLRIGYEFDGPWNCYNSTYYIDAFQYIKQQIDTLGATNVATVWQSAAWPLDTDTADPQYDYIVTDPNHLDEWYPGDQYVDYVALSDFYNSGSEGEQWGCSSYSVDPVTLQNTVLNFARAHDKPAMIAESAPQGYSNANLTQSCIMNKNPQATTAQGIWNQWYAPYFQWIENNSDVIRVVSYINTDWDQQTQWMCGNGDAAGGTGCSNGYWGDSAVQDNPTILSDFLSTIKQCIFVNGSTGTCPTGGASSPPSSAPPTSSSPTPSASPTATATGGTSGSSFSEGVAGGEIFFRPSGFTASSVYVHYTISGQSQLNYAMTWSASAGQWQQPISLSAGQSVSFSFDYTPTGQSYQDTTPTYSYTA